MSYLTKISQFCHRNRCFELSFVLATSLLQFGSFSSIGFLFLPLLDKYNEDRSKTVLVISLFRGLSFGLGVISSYLIKRFGVKRMSLTGCLLASSGFIAAFFAKNLFQLYMTVGVLCGFGNSLLVVSVNITVTKLVEEKNIPLGLGVLNFAPGIATVTYPYFLDHLYQKYSLSGTFLLLGGINLHSLTIVTLSLILESAEDRRKGLCLSLKDTANPENQEETTVPKETKSRGMVCFSSFIVIIYTTVTTLVSLCIGGFTGLWRDMFLEKQLSTSQSNIAFMSFGIMNAIARLCPILVQRFATLSVFFVPTVSSASGLIGYLLLHAFSTFEMTVFGSCFVGLSAGGVNSSTSLIMYEILGKETYPYGFGLFLTMSGVSAIASGIVFGAMVDETSSYDTVTLTTSGVMLVSSILCLVCLLTWTKIKQNCMQ